MEINSKYLLMNGESHRLLHNAVLNGTHRNKKFLDHIINCDLISLPGMVPENKEDFKSNLYNVLQVFEDKYKDDFELDFAFDDNRRLIPYFKVIYPKFKISNSKGLEHEIRDLIVVHTFTYESGHFAPRVVKGGRLSKTGLEIKANYQQSHLSGHGSWPSSPLTTTKFCIGSEDVSRLYSDFSLGIDWEDGGRERYELLLFSIDTMVTWESLEGVPYMYIANIKDSTANRVTTYDNGTADSLIQFIVESRQILLDLDFYVEEGRYRIKHNQKAQNFFKSIITANLSLSTYRNIIVSTSPTTPGTYLAYMPAIVQSQSEITGRNQYTLFRGKKIHPRLITIKKESQQQQSTSLDHYIIYPNFLDYVTRKLETRIYSKITSQSRARRNSESRNASRGTTADTASL